jgi:hypothetical protein
VSRLPLKYRVPFVLCYLEGKTTDEAALELGWPRGTVATRLAWARERLRQRLTRRGLAVSAAVLATALSRNGASATLPVALVGTIFRSGLPFMNGDTATGAVSASVAALAEDALKTITVAKAKLTVVVLLATGLLATGAGLAMRKALVANQPQVKEQEQPQAAENVRNPSKSEDAGQARTDAYGDPLPAGAVARLGTLRWRAPGEVEALAFAPDGKMLASASPTGPVGGLCLFDVASGKRTKHIYPSDAFIGRIAFSPDGSQLGSSGFVVRNQQHKNIVQIWNVAAWRRVQEFEAKDMSCQACIGSAGRRMQSPWPSSLERERSRSKTWRPARSNVSRWRTSPTPPLACQHVPMRTREEFWPYPMSG